MQKKNACKTRASGLVSSYLGRLQDMRFMAEVAQGLLESGLMLMNRQKQVRVARLRQRTVPFFTLAPREWAVHHPRTFSRRAHRRMGFSTVFDGIHSLFTPVPVPREDRTELRLGGCAAIRATGSVRAHVFLDWNERLGHELCSLRLRRPSCEQIKISSPRYWDFRDCSDWREKPKFSPYDTVRNFLLSKTPNPFPRPHLIDWMLVTIAARPDLGRRWLGSDLITSQSPVDGFLRTRCLPQSNGTVTTTTRYADEAIVLNVNTIQTT